MSPSAPPSQTREAAISLTLSDRERLQFQQLAQINFWSQRSQDSANRPSEGLVENPPGTTPERWSLLRGVKLHDWQVKAVDSWFRANGRGIIKVVTGAGKTVLALAIAERLQNSQQPDLRVAIIVPTLVLLNQWKQFILDHSNLPADSVRILGAGRVERFDGDAKVLIAVVNSAAESLPQLVHSSHVGDQLLLIVDECHRAGASQRRKLFQATRRYTLGLSATPERDDETESDDLDSLTAAPSGDEVLATEIGPIVFAMNYAEAIEKGVLSPFTIEHYGLALDPAERDRYDRLSREITDIRRELEGKKRRGTALLRWCQSAAGQRDPRAQRFLFLTSERKFLLYRIKARFEAVKAIVSRAIDQNPAARIIIFHESIADVMQIFGLLRNNGFSVVAEHSEFPDRLRSESIELFRSGTAQIIVSAKSLIEGFNVPAADLGIVVAASSSIRQRIQTLGRLLRRGETSDKRAKLVVFYATQTADEFIYEKADWESFVGAERNEYYLWDILSGTEPVRSHQAPRKPKLKDSDIQFEDLIEGGSYPGRLEGNVFSFDTQGNVIDETNKVRQPVPGLSTLLTRYLRSGGRFFVTPQRRYILKTERSTERGPEIVWLGVAPDPLFQDQPAQDSNKGELELNERYTRDLANARQFSVLQRDPRLIARKEGRRVRFVMPPDKLDDADKANQLRELITSLHRVYGSGRLINKILVTESGDVVYQYGGIPYYIGKAPEGVQGFKFDES